MPKPKKKKKRPGPERKGILDRIRHAVSRAPELKPGPKKAKPPEKKKVVVYEMPREPEEREKAPPTEGKVPTYFKEMLSSKAKELPFAQGKRDAAQIRMFGYEEHPLVKEAAAPKEKTAGEHLDELEQKLKKKGSD